MCFKSLLPCMSYFRRIVVDMIRTNNISCSKLLIFYFSMKSAIKICIGLFLPLCLLTIFCLKPVEAQPVLMTTNNNSTNDQSSIDSKNIDDLLGPDTNFPFDPANHRDGSNPIKRIGKISDDNL